jgi:hypothetical protein
MAAQQRADRDAAALPHLGVHADRRESGNGVDLVDAELARLIVTEAIAAAVGATIQPGFS